MVDSMTALERRVADLTAENEELRERLAGHDGRNTGDMEFPVEWRLSPTEAAIFQALIRRERLRRESLWDLLYGDRQDGGPEPKILDVLIFNLRRKVSKLGVTILTIHGFGWRLDAGDRAWLRERFPK